MLLLLLMGSALQCRKVLPCSSPQDASTDTHAITILDCTQMALASHPCVQSHIHRSLPGYPLLHSGPFLHYGPILALWPAYPTLPPVRACHPST